MPTVRNLHSALNPAIKSLNYLNNILAKIEAINGGCEEAIMLNARGLCGGMHRRQYFPGQGRASVHPAAFGRGACTASPAAWCMDLARQNGLTVSEPNVTRYDLFNADECFLTGTGAEIIAGGQN